MTKTAEREMGITSPMTRHIPARRPPRLVRSRDFDRSMPGWLTLTLPPTTSSAYRVSLLLQQIDGIEHICLSFVTCTAMPTSASQTKAQASYHPPGYVCPSVSSTWLTQFANLQHSLGNVRFPQKGTKAVPDTESLDRGSDCSICDGNILVLDRRCAARRFCRRQSGASSLLDELIVCVP